MLIILGNQHSMSHAHETNHGETDPHGHYASKKWVTGRGLVDKEPVAKRSAEPDTESFRWIPESEDNGEDDGVSKRDTEEEHESFPWIQ